VSELLIKTSSSLTGVDNQITIETHEWVKNMDSPV
jgi:hypothetical protein